MLTINTKASYTGNCGMSGKDWTGGRNGKAERAGTSVTGGRCENVNIVGRAW